MPAALDRTGWAGLAGWQGWQCRQGWAELAAKMEAGGCCYAGDHVVLMMLLCLLGSLARNNLTRQPLSGGAYLQMVRVL